MLTYNRVTAEFLASVIQQNALQHWDATCDGGVRFSPLQNYTMADSLKLLVYARPALSHPHYEIYKEWEDITKSEPSTSLLRVDRQVGITYIEDKDPKWDVRSTYRIVTKKKLKLIDWREMPVFATNTNLGLIVWKSDTTDIFGVLKGDDFQFATPEDLRLVPGHWTYLERDHKPVPSGVEAEYKWRTDDMNFTSTTWPTRADIHVFAYRILGVKPGYTDEVGNDRPHPS